MAVNLFFIPHQDDEALTFGAGIRNHLNTGDECHVILYTDGSSSNVFRQLNGETKSSMHRKLLNPKAEGYTPLGRSDLIRCRNDEFLRSCEALGLPAQNVHVVQEMQDGTTTVEACEALIREFADRYHGARIKTFTDLGGNHRDHANMGRAALNLYQQEKIADLRLYIEPYNLRQAKKARRKLEVLKERPESNRESVVASLREYKKWDPQREQFAIGYHSVRKEIDAAIANPISYYHKPYVLD
ncbi:PIG-L family deacetylase [Saccharibacillus kuerlensis]|uniref:PIG-L family deacetylase n=1 Tax=Saccharibacillus kuerlensis TaxID=459527 RepID=A0ABQ2L9B9_9BACL|nr:PIG-L family deacetylase [Saccharibacillus kuerlensis]GGO06387.1 PIG-L family deacetylase [Saccharibacillus kuerlensis]